MWNGKKLCQVYPHATKFEVFKFKFKRFFRRLFWILLTLAILFGIFKAGSYYNPAMIYQVSEREVVVDNLTGKIDELKENLVTDIMKCESAGYTEDDGIIIFDSNKKASIGVYQFQIDTVVYYYKTLYNQDITKKEAIIIAIDENKAHELATDIIFNTDKGLSNWVNCTKKVGATQQLEIIRQLEK